MLDIIPYKSERLREILYIANKKKTPLESINESNQHIKFLSEYLGQNHGLNARFCIIENEYINVDYLTDYSFYYSKSFTDYGNKCVRLHFFTFEDDNLEQFRSLLVDKITMRFDSPIDDKDLWDKYYLGYIVIRPIPSTFIGHTILKHYNYNKDLTLFNEKREYWGTKEYPINFFGKKLKVESLAFMSQDGNVAACATIAVWCMLQIAVENYFINLKSPYEITKDAGITVHNGNRLFPNTGLDPVSICSAITKSNLVTEIRELLLPNKKKAIVGANSKIKKLVNAYSNLKLPIILGMYVHRKGKLVGHAVALNGHSYSSLVETTEMSMHENDIDKSETDICWRSESIDKLYAHDDQWGPFAKMELIGDNEILSSWTTHTDETKNCIPISIIVPVFKKVRVSYEEIEYFTIGLNEFIELELKDQLNEKITWDIKLYYSTEYKKSVKYSGLLSNTELVENTLLINFLTEPLPKYTWVSSLYFGDFHMIDFIYDATGLKHSNCFLFCVCYYPDFYEKMKNRLIDLNSEYSINDHEARMKLQRLLGNSIDRFIENFTLLYAKN